MSSTQGRRIRVDTLKTRVREMETLGYVLRAERPDGTLEWEKADQHDTPAGALDGIDMSK